MIAFDHFPLIKEDDDLAEIIVETAAKNGLGLEDGDVIVAAQKIFSKSENRTVRLQEITPSRKAKEIAKKTAKNPRFVEIVLRETKKILKATRSILLVRDRRGIVCINAGIDKSNVLGKDCYALLPENPDLSCKKCCTDIMKITGKQVAVIMSDTYSRPFRRGQVNFAIGAAGIEHFRDYRGKTDLFNQGLKVKNSAVVDEIAAAAELLMGQAREGRPVILFRGLKNLVSDSQEGKIDELYISAQQDLFRKTLCL